MTPTPPPQMDVSLMDCKIVEICSESGKWTYCASAPQNYPHSEIHQWSVLYGVSEMILNSTSMGRHQKVFSVER